MCESMFVSHNVARLSNMVHQSSLLGHLCSVICAHIRVTLCEALCVKQRALLCARKCLNGPVAVPGKLQLGNTTIPKQRGATLPGIWCPVGHGAICLHIKCNKFLHLLWLTAASAFI